MRPRERSLKARNIIPGSKKSRRIVVLGKKVVIHETFIQIVSSHWIKSNKRDSGPRSPSLCLIPVTGIEEEKALGERENGMGNKWMKKESDRTGRRTERRGSRGRRQDDSKWVKGSDQSEMSGGGGKTREEFGRTQWTNFLCYCWLG